MNAKLLAECKHAVRERNDQHVVRGPESKGASYELNFAKVNEWLRWTIFFLQHKRKPEYSIYSIKVIQSWSTEFSQYWLHNLPNTRCINMIL